MLEIIKKVINEWDPIGLMEFAPQDEYDDECLLIFQEFSKNQESLGKVIYDTFNKSFGEAFQDNLTNCIKIAEEIEKKTSAD